MPTPRLFSRRESLRLGASCAALLAPRWVRAQTPREFDVRKYGAAGDGQTLDTAAIQRAIDEASASGGRARVLVPGGRRYLIAGLILKSGVDLHLADDAELIASAEPDHYGGHRSDETGSRSSVIGARGGTNIKLTGTGSVNGRSELFTAGIKDEWLVPKPFRPRLFLLEDIQGLEVSGITMVHSPSWTLHMLGCQDVLIDGIKIRNVRNMPNCDGIDPDHCRNVEISHCDILGGDDSVVIKTSRRGANRGPSQHIRVRDCVLDSQSSALKIGTESVSDMSDIVFERCRIVSSCRALCIQLRDQGNVSNVEFRDIQFVSRFFSDPWWGLGEGISLTAFPRTPSTQVGTISGVRIRNVTGRSENSVRINGSQASRIRDVQFDNVAVTLDRWTEFIGGRYDNRPGSVYPEIVPHGTSCYDIQAADDVVLNNCRANWGHHRPDYFTSALEAKDTTGLKYPGFRGEAAHPERGPAISIT